jgi:hypothetical protein
MFLDRAVSAKEVERQYRRFVTGQPVSRNPVNRARSAS